ncbi:MAG: PAS domain S-box protein [Deltaproteobacteria bacterium]|nr:PAS domain S-box protein [Deltaproteobacteria bacterium]
MDFKIRPFSTSIKTKVTAISILIIMTVTGGMATYFISVEAGLLRGELKKRAAALVENFSRNCDYPLLLEDSPAIEKLAAAMMRDGDVTLIGVNRADGQVLYLESKERIAGADWSTVARGDAGETSMREEAGTLFVTRPVWPPSEEDFLFSGDSPGKRAKNPLGRVTIGFSLKPTNALILRSVATASVIAFAIALVSIAILMIFLGRFFGPLLVIAQGIRRLSEGSLSHRLNFARRDEIGALAGAFNHMAETLEGSRKRIEEVNQSLEEKVRKRTEALRDSETRYRAFFESTGTAMVIIEEDGFISLVNAEFEKMLGFRRDEVEGKMRWISFFAAEEAEKMLQYNKRRLSEPQKEPGHCECRILDHESRTTDGFFTLSSVPGTTKMICSLIDISDRKRLEQEFREIQKMEAIGTLAGGIAHDFNNLLMGVQGYTSLMLLDLGNDHHHFEKLKAIEEYVQSGANLTRQLLAFARGGKYEVKPTNLSEIVEKTAMLFGRTRKEIRIKMKFEPDLWPVNVDRGQMEQVFLNLYVNAWHAMPGGGDLYLQTANHRLPGDGDEPPDADPGEYVRVSIRDTGVGMDEKTRSRIFEPFFTTKKMGRGTGLGLASVYGIIQGHGGTIGVESEKGKGTTFHICLPASHGEVSAVAPAREVLEKGQGTILLVDDEEGIVSVSRELLTHLGYQVLTAKSGSEALDLYREKGATIDLVILDMIMPGMSGGETFDLLKQLNPGIRVILSSGYSLDGPASRIMEQGCRSFMQKPFNLSLLSQKIREAVQP